MIHLGFQTGQASLDTAHAPNQVVHSLAKLVGRYPHTSYTDDDRSARANDRGDYLGVHNLNMRLGCLGSQPRPAQSFWMRSYSALNSQPISAIAEIRYIHTSSAMPAPMEPYITL